MYPRKGKDNYLLLYFHRYYRLVFPILFITFIGLFLIKYLGDGPYYRRNWEFLVEPCKTKWWTNLLFINNIYPWENLQECLPWVWYLANDFQFFIVTPPIIYAYCKRRTAGYAIVLLLTFASMLVIGICTAVYNIPITLQGGEINSGDVLYSKPWARMGAYFVGAFFGFGYFELACQDKYPELKGTFMNRMYEALGCSRLRSILVAIFGTALTAVYVFPLRNYYID